MLSEASIYKINEIISLISRTLLKSCLLGKAASLISSSKVSCNNKEFIYKYPFQLIHISIVTNQTNILLQWKIQSIFLISYHILDSKKDIKWHPLQTW